MRATTSRSVRARRVPGEPGVWVLVLGDMTIFAVLFAALVALHAQDPAAYAASQAHLRMPIGLANTVVLLTSSLAVAAGVRALAGGRRAAARRLLHAAIACGVVFAALKGVEYAALLGDGHGLRDSQFLAHFFGATGLHLFHVLVGLGALAVASRAAGRPAPAPGESRLVGACASYWHMVDLLWIGLFTLLYLLGR